MDHPVVLKNDSLPHASHDVVWGVLVMLLHPWHLLKRPALMGETRLKPPRAQRLARIPLERLGWFDQSP